MSAIAPSPVVYPDSDGLPMAENTVQFDWIAMLKWTAEAQFRNRADVFVAGDHLIYPVEGNNTLRYAPDTYIAFGRPKADRGSYRVWDEAGIFPQVIFEVWSPGNRRAEMEAKRAFYEEFGAEEFYLIFPDDPQEVEGWHRVSDRLVPISEMHGFVSPRLGWTFQIQSGELTIVGADGRILQRPDEIAAERDEIAAERDEIAVERDEIAAERDWARTDRDRERRERERVQAERDQATRKAEALAAKLRALGIDPDAVS